MKEEGNTEEDSKEEEKEGNVESKTEVIQHAGVTCRRQTGTRRNDGDKSQGSRASINVWMRQRRTRKELVNCARRIAWNQTGTSSGRAGCATGQTVYSKGEQEGQYGRHKYDKWMVNDTVFNLILRMQAVV